MKGAKQEGKPYTHKACGKIKGNVYMGTRRGSKLVNRGGKSIVNVQSPKQVGHHKQLTGAHRNGTGKEHNTKGEE